MIEKIKSRFIQNKHFLEVLKGGIFSFGAKMLTLILGFASTWIITNYYGSEILGILTLMNSILGIILIFSIAGLGTSLLRFIPEHIQKFSKYSAFLIYKRSLFIVSTLSIIIGLLIYYFHDYIAITLFKKPEVTWLFSLIALLIFIQSMNGMNITVIRALKNIKMLTLTTVIKSLLFFTLLAVLTHLQYKKHNPIYIEVAIDIIVFFVAFAIVYFTFIKNTNKAEYEKVSTKTILTVSFPMFITGALNSIITQTDVIMLGNMLDSSQVGLYAMAMKLGMLSSFFLTAINTLAAPKFAELYHSQKFDDLKIVAQNSSKILFWVTLPLTLFFIVFGKYILGLFGEEFILSYSALVFLLIGQFVNAISGSVGNFLNMTGYQRLFNYIILFSAILNIILNLILIPKFGISGAAFASMISFISWNLISSIIVRRKFQFYIGYLPLLK